MKVWDRYYGSEAELPDVVESGRFQVLSLCTLNGHTLLNKGDVLWGDGGLKCALTGDRTERTFAAVDNGQSDGSPDPKIDEAVGAVTDQLDGDELPSPIMPSQLEKHVDLLHFEKLLANLLEAGHLQSISQRPRLDMRYDVEVLPVSRARRLAPDALTALASNSRDWSRRRITGIVPARLKALVSDDEHGIYENVVFARLVDRFQKLLRARIRDVSDLLKKHKKAEVLSNAQQLDRRLRQDICTLWGQSFADNPAAGARARETYDALIKLRGKVQQLQHKGLYTQVSRQLTVPNALRNTNILQHDLRYQHLRPIWLIAHSAFDREMKTPRQTFEAERALGERYGRYIELLVRRALSASLLVKWSNAGVAAAFGPWELRIAGQKGSCNLELFNGVTLLDHLTIVAGRHGRLDWVDQRDDYYVFFCHHPEAAENDSGDDSVLNPLQFYSVERVRLAIEKWLLKQSLSRYPFHVTPVPADLQAAILAAAGSKVRKAGNGIQFCEPLRSNARIEIGTAVGRGSANERTKARLHEALKLAEMLGLCHVCGNTISPSDFRASESGFRADCGACGANWTLKMVDGRPDRAEYRVGKVDRPFVEVGCRQIQIDWLVPGQPSKYGGTQQ